jgi:hypothetical protein
MTTIKEVIDSFPNELQSPMLEFWGAVKESLGVKKEDFTELKNVVFELAEAQKRTEFRVEELAEAQKRTEIKVEELAEAQKRTEIKVEELAEAQKRTEIKVEELAEAQKRTEIKVEELAEAQKRTEIKVEELAEAQKNTELALKDLARTVEFKIGGLGRKWGVESERSFRNGLTTILSDTGYEVLNYIVKDTEGFVFGHPSEIEIDVIVTGEKTLVVELKASVCRSDVFVFLKKGEFYTKITGKKVDRMIMITPFVEDQAREVADQFNVTICDSITDLGTSISP